MRVLAIPWLVLGLMCCTFANAQNTPESATQPGPGRVDWRDLLQKYGAKFSLRFTIESDLIDADHDKDLPLLEGHFIAEPKDGFKNSDDFLKALQKWLPEAEITIDKAMPQIVHIREKSLDKRGQLILDEKISLTFDGTVEQFLEKLTQKSAARLKDDDNSGAAIATDQGFYDQQVHLAADVKDITYGALLTKVIPPNNNRILWEAFVVKEEEKLVTYIKLCEPTNAPPAKP